MEVLPALGCRFHMIVTFGLVKITDDDLHLEDLKSF